jgi:hypothetical protein
MNMDMNIRVQLAKDRGRWGCRYKYRNEPSGPLEGWEFLEQFKNDSATCSLYKTCLLTVERNLFEKYRFLM